MFKNVLKIFLSAVILLSLFSPNAFASEKEIPYTEKDSEVTITEELEQSIDVNELPNTGEATFTPDSKNNEEFQTFGLSFARGTIGCYTIGSNAYCPWTIQVGGDVVNYSNVVVYLERNEGFLNGGWERYSTFNFNYRVNVPTSTIRNEASFRLPKGSYRAKLGGSFITVKNGKYSAIANGPSYFEIK